MTIQQILAGEGSQSVYYGLMLNPVFDEEGNEVEPVSPVVNGTFDPVANPNYCIFNTGKGSFKTTFASVEGSKYFIGWIKEAPSNSPLLTII